MRLTVFLNVRWKVTFFLPSYWIILTDQVPEVAPLRYSHSHIILDATLLSAQNATFPLGRYARLYSNRVAWISGCNCPWPA